MIGPPAHPAGHESAGGDAEAQGGRDRLERRLQPHSPPQAGGGTTSFAGMAAPPSTRVSNEPPAALRAARAG